MRPNISVCAGSYFDGVEKIQEHHYGDAAPNVTVYDNGVKETKIRLKRTADSSDAEMVDISDLIGYSGIKGVSSGLTGNSEGAPKSSGPFSGIMAESNPDAMLVDINQLQGTNVQNEDIFQPSVTNLSPHTPLSVASSLSFPEIKDDFMLLANEFSNSGVDSGDLINTPGGGGTNNTDAEMLLCDPMKRPPYKWSCNVTPCKTGL